MLSYYFIWKCYSIHPLIDFRLGIWSPKIDHEFYWKKRFRKRGKKTKKRRKIRSHIKNSSAKESYLSLSSYSHCLLRSFELKLKSNRPNSSFNKSIKQTNKTTWLSVSQAIWTPAPSEILVGSAHPGSCSKASTNSSWWMCFSKSLSMTSSFPSKRF